MKSLFRLCCAAAFLAALPASAQSPSPAPKVAKSEVSNENYVLALSPAGKEGDGFSVIVTPPQVFGLSHDLFSFSGTLTQTENGVYRLDYRLETNGGRVGTGSSVTLRPGEPVQLVKNGEQFYNLRLDRYPPPDATKPTLAPALAH